MSFNMEEHPDGVPLVLSEKETISSYDNETNTFYESVPNDDVMKVKVIKKITAKALEEADVEALYYE